MIASANSSGTTCCYDSDEDSIVEEDGFFDAIGGYIFEVITCLENLIMGHWIDPRYIPSKALHSFRRGMHGRMELIAVHHKMS